MKIRIEFVIFPQALCIYNRIGLCSEVRWIRNTIVCIKYSKYAKISNISLLYLCYRLQLVFAVQNRMCFPSITGNMPNYSAWFYSWPLWAYFLSFLWYIILFDCFKHMQPHNVNERGGWGMRNQTLRLFLYCCHIFAFINHFCIARRRMYGCYILVLSQVHSILGLHFSI